MMIVEKYENIYFQRNVAQDITRDSLGKPRDGSGPRLNNNQIGNVQSPAEMIEHFDDN